MGPCLTSCSANAHSKLRPCTALFLYAFCLFIKEKWNYSFGLVLDARSDNAGRGSWIKCI